MRANAYLNFNGQCEKAFRFYAEAMGGAIDQMVNFENSPMADQMPPEARKMIIHASMRIGDTVLMASDAPGDRYQKPQGFSVSLIVDTTAEAERVFAALSSGGEVRMALQRTFFAARFGMLTDKFGIPWMVNCEKEG
jgi:PhnB protein